MQLGTQRGKGEPARVTAPYERLVASFAKDHRGPIVGH